MYLSTEKTGLFRCMYDYIQVLSGWISHGCSNTEIVIDWFVKDQPWSNIRNKQKNKFNKFWQDRTWALMELTKFDMTRTRARWSSPSSTITNKQTSCDKIDTWAHMELTKFGYLKLGPDGAHRVWHFLPSFSLFFVAAVLKFFARAVIVKFTFTNLK